MHRTQLVYSPNHQDKDPYRAKQPAEQIQNTNIETRNNFKIRNTKIQNASRNTVCLEHWCFCHLILFRISDFVLRNSCSWRSRHVFRLRLILQSIGFVTLAGFISGCMVGPDYQRPAVEVPLTWRVEDKNAQAVTSTAWWEQYNDPVLNGLVESALEENKDVKIAAARIEQFLGLYTTTRAALFPQVGGSTSVGRQRDSALQGGFSGGTFNNFDVFLSANWELDLWGKLRRATESARATLLSTEAARRSVLLTLVAAVANSYINLRDLDKQLEVTRQTADSYQAAYELFKLRFDYGVVSQIELNQAKAQYEQALANIPVFQRATAQEENALSVLLGRNPGPIPRGKTLDDLALPSVPAYLPSEVLVNRPDIRQAEENLIAANADIGVAKAQYFPSVFLTGALGTASSDLSTLFTPPGRIWSIAAPLTVPIFTAGAIAGQVKTAEALQQEALFRYQQVIQVAFREVDDALVDQQRTREELASLTQQVETLREYVTLARLRYDEGYASYLEVTYAENLLYEAQVRRIQVQGALFQAFANLYKATGVGG